MASAPGSPGTSLTARSCCVMGSHPPCDSLSLSLSLAARFKPEINRSDMIKASARDMGPVSTQRKLSKALGGVERNIYQDAGEVPEFLSEIGPSFLSRATCLLSCSCPTHDRSH